MTFIKARITPVSYTHLDVYKRQYDTNPQYSPDGKYIAWQSMERDGYEADLNRLFLSLIHI